MNRCNHWLTKCPWIPSPVTFWQRRIKYAVSAVYLMVIMQSSQIPSREEWLPSLRINLALERYDTMSINWARDNILVIIISYVNSVSGSGDFYFRMLCEKNVLRSLWQAWAKQNRISQNNIIGASTHLMTYTMMVTTQKKERTHPYDAETYAFMKGNGHSGM